MNKITVEILSGHFMWKQYLICLARLE